jgi:WD40 repeat protein
MNIFMKRVNKISIVLLFQFLFLLNSAYSQQTLRVVMPVGHTTDISSVKINTFGNLFVTASEDYTAKIWNAQSGELLNSLEGHSGRLTCVNFSHDGKFILTASEDGTVKIWDVESGNMLLDFKEHNENVLRAEFSKKNSNVLSYSEDGKVFIWDCKTGKTIQSFKVNKSIFGCVNYLMDENAFFISSDSCIDIVNILNGEIIVSIKDGQNEFWNAGISKNGKFLYAITTNKNLLIIDLDSFRIKTRIISNYNIIGADFDEPNNRIITTSQGGIAELWDYESGNLLSDQQIKGFIAFFNKNTKQINSLSAKNILSSWNNEFIHKNNLEFDFHGIVAPINNISTNFETSSLITFFDDKTIDFWDYKNGNSKIFRDTNFASFLFSNENYFVTSTTDSQFEIKNVNTFERLLKIKNNSNLYNWFSFTSDKNKIISTRDDGVIEFYDIQKGNRIFNVKCSDSFTIGLILTNKDEELITESSDHKIGIWDLRKMKYTRYLSNDVDKIEGLDDFIINSNLKYAAAYSNSSSKLNIWNYKNGKVIKSITDKRVKILKIMFNREGTILIVSLYQKRSRYSELRLYDLATGNLLQSKENSSLNFLDLIIEKNQILLFDEFAKEIKIWDLDKNNMDSIKLPIYLNIKSIKLLDNECFVILTKNNQILFFNITGKLLYTRMHALNKDWIAFNPDFFMTGSEILVKKVNYFCGNSKLNSELFRHRFHKFDLIKQVMSNSKNNSSMNVFQENLGELKKCNLAKP